MLADHDITQSCCGKDIDSLTVSLASISKHDNVRC
jgi:hypothetical protein